jgi:hypothetical protein
MVTKDNNLDYYIFLIFNKKGEIFGRVYDLEQNIMYDNDEVVINIPNNGALEWAKKEIAEKVSHRAVQAYAWKGNQTGTTANLYAESKNGQMALKTCLDDDDDVDIYYSQKYGYDLSSKKIEKENKTQTEEDAQFIKDELKQNCRSLEDMTLYFGCSKADIKKIAIPFSRCNNGAHLFVPGLGFGEKILNAFKPYDRSYPLSVGNNKQVFYENVIMELCL